MWWLYNGDMTFYCVCMQSYVYDACELKFNLYPLCGARRSKIQCTDIFDVENHVNIQWILISDVKEVLHTMLVTAYSNICASYLETQSYDPEFNFIFSIYSYIMWNWVHCMNLHNKIRCVLDFSLSFISTCIFRLEWIGMD